MERKAFVLLVLLGFFLSERALAAVPADVLSPEGTLEERERRIVEQVRQLAHQGTGSSGTLVGGKLVFVHGAEGGIPTIIAAPLQVVDVELEPGEMVNEIVLGDTARWQIEPGTAGKSTHLFIKPVDTGLETSAVITTDRRAYHLRLLSRTSDITPYVGFTYQTDLQAQVAAAKARAKKQQTWRTDEHDVDLSKLNFAYDVEGASGWKPERVYDDGRKMYVQLPEGAGSGEMPALMVMKGKREVLVNYRVRSGHTMEVDGVFDQVALVVGVGKEQERVDIYRKGARRSPGHFTGAGDRGDR